VLKTDKQEKKKHNRKNFWKELQAEGKYARTYDVAGTGEKRPSLKKKGGDERINENTYDIIAPPRKWKQKAPPQKGKKERPFFSIKTTKSGNETGAVVKPSSKGRNRIRSRKSSRRRRLRRKGD